jgi:hypothetical protein
MEDGLILMYVKNDTLYPIAITQEQHDLLQLVAPTAIFNGKVKVITDKPQGKAINLISAKEG